MHIVFNEDGTVTQGAIGIDGRPVERTKRDHPYNYDAFLVWGEMDNAHTGDVYSDRMRQQNPEQYEKASKEVFGKWITSFSQATPEEIELLLQKYYKDETLRLVRYFEGCNASDGFPMWLFVFHQDGKPERN